MKPKSRPTQKEFTRHICRYVAAYNVVNPEVLKTERNWLDANFPGWEREFDSTQGHEMVMMANSSVYLQVLGDILGCKVV